MVFQHVWIKFREGSIFPLLPHKHFSMPDADGAKMLVILKSIWQNQHLLDQENRMSIRVLLLFLFL